MYLVLFDIDGTLLTSNGAARPAIQIALESVCERPIRLDGISFSGRTDPAILADIFLLNGIHLEHHPALMEPALQRYGSELARSVRPESITVLPGVVALLDQLNARRDVHLGLLTGNVRITADIKLQAAGLDGYFTFGAFGCDHADRNELPAIANRRAGDLHGREFPPSRTIIIGDTEHDIACSRHFGGRSVAVSTGHVTHEHLAEHAPDVLLQSLEQAEPILDLLWSQTS